MIVSRVFMRSLLLVALSVLLLCTACQDDGKGGAVPTSSEENEGGNGRARRRVELDLEEGARRSATDGSGEDSGEGDSRIVELPQASPFVVSGGEIVHAIPEDMVIGQLQSRYASDSATRAVVEVAERFLNALLEAFASATMEGTAAEVLSAEVSPERREETLDWIAFNSERAPAPGGFRIGVVRFDGEDTAWSRVVFRRAGATAEGELHLSKLQAGGGSVRWYVTDLLVQFGQLSDVGNEEIERFEPTEYPSAPLAY